MAPFQPYPWQVAPWRDLSLIVLLTGSAGGGKSRLAAEKLHGFCLKYPGSTALMLRKTRESMTNSTVLMVEHQVIGGMARHVSSKLRFEYKNGSYLIYGGMADNEQREAVRSIGATGGVDIAWMEEATAFWEDDFNELLPRMRGGAGGWNQILLSTNPGPPTHWIYKRLIEGHEAHTYLSAAKDNPANPPGYLATLAKLTGPLGLRLRDGLWVSAEGMVYEAWNPLVHTVERFPIPEEWRRFRVVDFGYTNPFVCQWWAADPDGRLYRYRELYGTKRTVNTWAEQINALSAGERIEATICDHDAEDRATLFEHDISTVAARKEIGPGIQAVADRLVDAGDGRPRLYLVRDALVEADPLLLDAKRPRCTEQEFPGYVWPRSGDGRPVKEQPIKEHDHGMDAVRYMVMYLDKGRIPDADAGDDMAGQGAAEVKVVTRGEGVGFEIRREGRGHKGFR